MKGGGGFGGWGGGQGTGDLVEEVEDGQDIRGQGDGAPLGGPQGGGVGDGGDDRGVRVTVVTEANGEVGAFSDGPPKLPAPGVL